MGGRHRAPGAAGVPGPPSPVPSRERARRARRGPPAGAPHQHRGHRHHRAHAPGAARRGPAPALLGALLVAVLVGGLGLAGIAALRAGAADPLLSAARGLADGGTAPSPAATAAAEDPRGSSAEAAAPSAASAVQALLDQRAAALVSRDRGSWLAAVGGADVVPQPARAALDAYRERTSAVFDRLAPVPLGGWAWEVTGSGPALPPARAQQLPAGSWVVRTTLVWSVEGAGEDPVRRQQDLTVVPRGTGWALVDDVDGETVPDLWDLGDVDVVRAERAVVLGTAGREQLERAAEVATTAAEGVDAVWGTAWPRSTVVEVPADQAQMAALLGRDDDEGLDQIAAVTTGELVGGSGATRGDHVVVNPTGFGQLAPLGQRVVLTHELTHVATRSGAVRAVPLWLSEGFADWVGYRGTGLSRQVVAADLLARVRADGPPDALPSAADFDPSLTSSIGPAYSGAWLAVDALARAHGDEAVVEVYRAASRDPLPGGPAAPGGGPAGTDEEQAEAGVDAALTAVVGTDSRGVLVQWRAELTELAGAGSAG